MILLLGIIITITGRDGKETTVEVPGGSQVKVDDEGNVDVKLPGGKQGKGEGQQREQGLLGPGRGGSEQVDAGEHGPGGEAEEAKHSGGTHGIPFPLSVVWRALVAARRRRRLVGIVEAAGETLHGVGQPGEASSLVAERRIEGLQGALLVGESRLEIHDLGVGVRRAHGGRA